MKAWLIGAAGYPLMELAFRKRTHYSMAVAGGISTALLHHIAGQTRPVWQKALAGGAAITAVEAICGEVWNRRYRVWDYRREPMNWRGQVCAGFTCLWCGLSAVWMCLDKPRRMA